MDAVDSPYIRDVDLRNINSESRRNYVVLGTGRIRPLAISKQATLHARLTRNLMGIRRCDATSEPCRSLTPIRHISKPTRPQLAPESWGRFFWGWLGIGRLLAYERGRQLRQGLF
jgi:hypothetical protein